MGRRPRRAGDLSQTDTSAPRNFLRPCVLLILKEEGAHGYELLERLVEFGFSRGDPGGLYRTLRAMEREGLVRSWWETSGIGPARRTYQTTEEGEDWLRVWASALGESRRLLALFLERYEQVLPAGKVGQPGR